MKRPDWMTDVLDMDGIGLRLRVQNNFLVLNVSGCFRLFDRAGLATLRAALEAAEKEMS